MAKNPYNGFSPEFRSNVGSQMSAAFKHGELTRPRTCVACGHEKPAAVIHAHNEDYHVIESFVGLCLCCHMAVHRRFQDIDTWHKWRDLVAAGRKPPAASQYGQFMAAWTRVARMQGDLFDVEIITAEPDRDNWVYGLPDVEPDLFTRTDG